MLSVDFQNFFQGCGRERIKNYIFCIRLIFLRYTYKKKPTTAVVLKVHILDHYSSCNKDILFKCNDNFSTFVVIGNIYSFCRVQQENVEGIIKIDSEKSEVNLMLIENIRKLKLKHHFSIVY